jgi:MFS family permease
VATNVFVGGMVGIERTVLPLIAEADFGIASAAAGTAFIVTFGVTKALINLFAGGLADRWGRKRLLITGWLFAFPVPLLLMYAPTWSWVLVANVLLGVNQSLSWSMTVVMKVDLAAPSMYGRVIGWNEFAGYAGMSVTALATGMIASTFGLRPEPFYVGLVVAATGLALSLGTRETRPRAEREPTSRGTDRGTHRSALGVLRDGTFAHPALSLASASGLATNLKDGALWGLLPILLMSREFSIEAIGFVVALYPAVWAMTQLYFGPLSDRVGRTGLIAGGLTVQALGVLGFVAGSSYVVAVLGAVLAGTGTGMVYPTLLAFVSERSTPQRMASALGVYRFWRDSGYAVGALGAGVLADALGLSYALGVVGLLLAIAAVAFHAGVGRKP